MSLAVPAQTLDLDGPPSPVVGDSSVVAAIAARLRAERDDMEGHAIGTARQVIAPAYRIRLAMREVALALVADAPRGVGGPDERRALAAMRIVDALGAIDAAASRTAELALAGERAVRAGGTDAEAIAAWERSRLEAELLVRRAMEVVEAIRGSSGNANLDEALGALSGALAPMAESGADLTPAWPVAGATDRGSVAEARASVRIDAAEAAIADAFAMLEREEQIVAKRDAARADAWMLADALRGVESLARAGIELSVMDGVRGAGAAMGDSGAREMARDRLRAIGAMGVVAERAAALEAEGVSIVGVREALGVFASEVSGALGSIAARDAELAIVAGAITRLVDDAAATPRSAVLDFKDPRFNRAWRATVRAHAEIEQRAFELAARAARSPSLLGTPEWVSGAQALHGSRLKIERIASLGEWIAELRGSGAPGVSGAVRAGAADRLTVIRKGFGYDEHRDAVLEAMAQWESMRAACEGLPGEALLRARDPRIEAVVRGRGEALVRVFDVTRNEWIGAWARAEEPQLIEGEIRMARLARLGRALESIAALREPECAARVSAWAALRVPENALDAIQYRAESLIAEACAAAIDAQHERLGRLVDEWDAQGEAARIVAGLSAAAMARSGWPEPAEGVAGLVRTIAPPPPGAWRLEARADLAAFSVWCAELAGAAERDDRGMADAIARWLNAVAEKMR